MLMTIGFPAIQFSFSAIAARKRNNPQILPGLCLPIPTLFSVAAVALPPCPGKLWPADCIGRMAIFTFLQNFAIHSY